MTYMIVELFSSTFSQVDTNPINSIDCNALTEGPNFYNIVMDPILKKISSWCKYIPMDSCYASLSSVSERQALYTYYTNYMSKKDSSHYMDKYFELYVESFKVSYCNSDNRHENFGRSGETCTSKLICLHEFYDPMIKHCPNGELWKSRVEKGLCDFVYQLVEYVRIS